MNSQIQITILGASQTGKTTFTLGMYSVLRAGVHSYYLHASERNDDLALRNRWKALVMRNGREWPAPNDEQPIPYQFKFKRNLETLMSIDWLDYRGGALESPDTHPDVRALINHLSQSTCLFLVVSGEHLTESVRGRVNAVQDEALITEMMVLLEKVGRPVPTVILVTKADLCRHREADGEKLREMICEDVRQLFPLCFSKGWYTMICPVSLGDHLGDNPDTAEIHPKSVHLPFIFSIQALFEQERARQHDTLQRLGVQANEHWEELDELEGRFLTLFGANKNKIRDASDRLAEAQQQVEAQQVGLAEVQDKVEALARELKKSVRFRDGERVPSNSQ